MSLRNKSETSEDDMKATHSPESISYPKPSFGCCGLRVFGKSQPRNGSEERPFRSARPVSTWNGENLESEKVVTKQKISNEELYRLPSHSELEELGKMTVLDRNRLKVPFKSLVTGTTEQRNIVIFIRHFFCGMCYGYVRAIAADLMPGKLEAMTPSTRLIVIGCGDPVLIPQYIKETGCPFEIYADPTRKLYQQLGFVIDGGANEEKPTYVKKYSPGLALNFLISGRMAAKARVVSGGMIPQNGGELIWINGELKFIHRMRNTTDHMETDDLQKLLKEQDEEMSERKETLGSSMDVASLTSQNTKANSFMSKRWSRPLSYIWERTGSIFSNGSQA